MAFRRQMADERAGAQGRCAGSAGPPAARVKRSPARGGPLSPGTMRQFSTATECTPPGGVAEPRPRASGGKADFCAALVPRNALHASPPPSPPRSSGLRRTFLHTLSTLRGPAWRAGREGLGNGGGLAVTKQTSAEDCVLFLWT